MSKEQDRKVEVFLSYKRSCDRTAARGLATELEILGRGRLAVFVDEKVEAGEEWPKEIHQKLQTAHWLILLYTDPTEDWDWCMYETGYFSASEPKKSRHLVCLHPVDCLPPHPLTQRKSVPATDRDVGDFLQDLLAKPPCLGVDPIYPELFSQRSLAKERRQRIKAIVQLIAPHGDNVKESRRLAPHLELTLPHSSLKEAKQEKMPADAKVRLDTIAARLVFATHKEDLVWSEFVELCSSDRDLANWGKDLVKGVARVANASDDVPTLPPLRPKLSPYAYRAVLYQTDELMSGGLKIHVTFATTLPGVKPDSEAICDRVSTAFSLTQQFCWQVLDQTRESRLRASRETPQGQLKCINDVITAVRLIVSEAHIQHVFLGDQVAKLFEGSNAQVRPQEVKATVDRLAEVIREIQGCADTTAPSPIVRWETFQDHVSRIQEICTFLLGALALRLSELYPLAHAPRP